MYFVYRGGYIAAPADLTFRKFMRDGWDGHTAIESDWALHLSTLFPEGRLKRVIEVRGADCGSMEMIAALAPFCRGLLYDQAACAAATALTAGLSFTGSPAHSPTRSRSPGSRRASARIRSASCPRELVAIVRDGLARVAPNAVSADRARRGDRGVGKRTQADHIRELWRTRTLRIAPALIRALAHPGLG